MFGPCSFAQGTAGIKEGLILKARRIEAWKLLIALEIAPRIASYTY
jgi:hypothetical protein